MRPAHQGKLLPDAAGAAYIVHVAVLLMTVKLKMLLVPECHTHSIAEHGSDKDEESAKRRLPKVCKPLVCEQIVPKTNADAAPDTVQSQ